MMINCMALLLDFSCGFRDLAREYFSVKVLANEQLYYWFVDCWEKEKSPERQQKRQGAVSAKSD